MKYKLVTALLVVGALVLSTLATFSVAGPAKAAPTDDPDSPQPTWPINGPCPSPPNPLNTNPPCPEDNAILKWDDELLQAVRDNPAVTGPTITARALGVLHTATYDAWAAYDNVAKGTRLGSKLRQPSSQRTEDNKTKAISYAAYRVLLELFPGRKADLNAQMAEFPYDPPLDPNDLTNFNLTDPVTAITTPQGVGNRVAKEVITFRNGDHSNPRLDPKVPENPSDDVIVYPDPSCTPTVTPECYAANKIKNQWNNVSDPWHWQPLCTLTSPAGVNAWTADHDAVPLLTPPNCVGPNYTIQAPSTPHWGNIIPFALTSAIQYKVPGPRKNIDGSYSTADIATAVVDTSNLDDTKKAKAEYWADGPKTEFPPGHMAVFAQAVSRKKNHSLDTDAKMFFALGNALMDASIAAWAFKYKYDYVRPITAIRDRYKSTRIPTPPLVNSWRGPGITPNFEDVPGEQWMPYQALNVVTPPFPEYPSGHSTFSAAGSQILMAFTGSDTFGASVTIPAGSLKIDSNTPSQEVVLSWPTFTAAADQAGWSRRYGGIHFKSGDQDARLLGKMIGQSVWSKASAYINGSTSG
jgi:hypothetical protein